MFLEERNPLIDEILAVLDKRIRGALTGIEAAGQRGEQDRLTALRYYHDGLETARAAVLEVSAAEITRRRVGDVGSK